MDARCIRGRNEPVPLTRPLPPLANRSFPAPCLRPALPPAALSANIEIATFVPAIRIPVPGCPSRHCLSLRKPATGGRILESIEDLLKESIAAVCGLAAADLRSDTRLADIGVDSLASAEVLV